MLSALFVSLFTAIAGQPAGPPPTAPQAAPAPSTAADSQQTADQADGLNRIAQRHADRCHKEFVTGSRLPALVCLSQADADNLERDGHEELRRAQSMWDSQSH